MTKVTGKEVVTLNAPIVRGETAISEITITPVLKQAGSLRGLKVYDVLTSNYDALVVLLPRVTAPALTADEIARMDTWDFCQLANAVVDFCSHLRIRAGRIRAARHPMPLRTHRKLNGGYRRHFPLATSGDGRHDGRGTSVMA